MDMSAFHWLRLIGWLPLGLAAVLFLSSISWPALRLSLPRRKKKRNATPPVSPKRKTPTAYCPQRPAALSGQQYCPTAAYRPAVAAVPPKKVKLTPSPAVSDRRSPPQKPPSVHKTAPRQSPSSSRVLAPRLDNPLLFPSCPVCHCRNYPGTTGIRWSPKGYFECRFGDTPHRF